MSPSFTFFFFNDTATTEIYTLSLHDALPIFGVGLALGEVKESALSDEVVRRNWDLYSEVAMTSSGGEDRKSTRLNSSHVEISYAVFCLKKKKKKKKEKKKQMTKTE